MTARAFAFVAAAWAGGSNYMPLLRLAVGGGRIMRGDCVDSSGFGYGAVSCVI